MEDNKLWMRHLFGLVVQFSVAVYVILMSWNRSWFSIMSIPALVAGFIKYGERTWVLMSVSCDKSGEIVPFGNNNTLEDKNSRHVLSIAHTCVREFMNYTQFYDLKNNEFKLQNPLELDEIRLFWNAIEVEMGLMFDLLYTKAAINFRKGGCILRCITFSCTVTVLVGLILRLISPGEDQENWHRVDIAITEVLLVGALALEIYTTISLYLFSDWATIWLIKHNRCKQVIPLREKISWLFIRKQYRYKMMGQLNLLDVWLNTIAGDHGLEPDQKVVRRILRSLLGIKRWVEEYLEYRTLKKYADKTVVPSLLFDRILNCCQHLTSPDLPPRRAVGEDLVWKEFFDRSFEEQIVSLHIATEICYNLEMEWDAHDASENDRDSAVSQHTMPPSDSSLSWEENRELCRTLSRYMMYLLAMPPSLLPTSSSDDYVSDSIPVPKPDTDGLLDVKAACRCLWESDEFGTAKIIKEVQSKHKDERWDIWKLMWVRMLCYATSKGQRNEHFRQLSQGGEFITFLWFFLPQSGPVLGISSPDSRIGLPVFGPKSKEKSGVELNFTNQRLALSFGSSKVR